MAGAIAEYAIREVRDLHAFFVAWFRPNSALAVDLARLEAALAADFRMVTPDGEAHERASVVARIKAARGNASDDFSIEIVQPNVVWCQDDAVLLEFVEQQYSDGRETSRRSTGLFTSAPGTPHGVAWRHLQETWMKPAERPVNGPSAGGRHDGG